MQTYTPEQIAILDGQLGQTTTVKKHNADINALKDNDEEVIKDLEGLKDGQNDINVRLEKGDKRMGSIEGEMKDMKDMIQNGDIKRDEQHAELKQQIQAKEMGELKAEIRKRNEKDEKDEAKKWDLAKIFLASAVTAVVAYVVFLLKGP